MEMNFDPITGKPIENGGASTGSDFDPMTGKPTGGGNASAGGFDPMTGEPTGGGNAFGGGFDPMTGQPIGGGNASSGMSFDPMTGEPIREGSASAGTGFDPMTGQPIGGGSAPTGGFDPMTGQPIGGGSAPSGMGFDPMTGQPLGKGAGKKSFGALKWVLGIAVPVVAVGVVVFAGIKSGLFLGKSGKVMMAVNNTFQDSTHLAEDLNFADILDSDKYTVEVSGEMPEGSAAITYGVSSDDKMLSGNLDISGMPEMEFLAMLDSEALRLSIPSLDDQVYAYYYQSENDGYLMSNVDQESIDAMNDALASLYSNSDYEDMVNDLKDCVKDELKNLEFEKASAREYEVDGKDRSCKGYVTVITADNMINIVDAMEDLFADQYGAQYELMMRENFDELRYELDAMSDIELTFYIYKNKLSAVNLYCEGSEIEWRFLGGDTRMQNMEIVADGETVMEVRGSVEGTEERTRVFADDVEVLDLQYDYKSGDFKVNAGQLFSCKGNIQSGKKEFSITLDRLEYAFLEADINGTVTVKKGVEKLDMDGEEFDIGNASLSDVEELGMKFYGLFGLSGLF